MIELQITNKKLTSSEKSILVYIKKYPQKFLETTITEFSKEVFCSITTISRFVKKAGFKNYQMLKNYISKLLYSKEEKNNDVNVNLIYENIGKKYIDSIKMNKDIKMKEIEKLITAISTNKKILIFGLGVSASIAQYFSESLNKINFFSIAIRDTHQAIQLLENSFSKDDIFIMISKDFASKELVYLLSVSQRKNISTFCITSNRDLKKRKLTNIIFFNHIKQVNRILSFSSKIISFYIIDIILFSLIKKNKVVKKSTLFDKWKNL